MGTGVGGNDKSWHVSVKHRPPGAHPVPFTALQSLKLPVKHETGLRQHGPCGSQSLPGSSHVLPTPKNSPGMPLPVRHAFSVTSTHPPRYLQHAPFDSPVGGGGVGTVHSVVGRKHNEPSPKNCPSKTSMHVSDDTVTHSPPGGQHAPNPDGHVFGMHTPSACHVPVHDSTSVVVHRPDDAQHAPWGRAGTGVGGCTMHGLPPPVHVLPMNPLSVCVVHEENSDVVHCDKGTSSQLPVLRQQHGALHTAPNGSHSVPSPRNTPRNSNVHPSSEAT